jgi:hypothetical protein
MTTPPNNETKCETKLILGGDTTDNLVPIDDDCGGTRLVNPVNLPDAPKDGAASSLIDKCESCSVPIVPSTQKQCEKCCHDWKHSSPIDWERYSDSLRAAKEQAERERDEARAELAELKRKRDNWPHNPTDLGGVEYSYRECDGRHMLFKDGLNIWQGEPVWNAFKAWQLSERLSSAIAQRDEFKALCVARDAEVARLRAGIHWLNHAGDCNKALPTIDGGNEPCSCGLDELMKGAQQ